MKAENTHKTPRKNAVGGRDIIALLGAATYTWRSAGKTTEFVWRDKDLAAALFCSRAEDIPHTEAEYTERLCGDALSARDQALASLSWNGAKFQIDYQIRTFDGRNIWVEERALRIDGDGKQPSHIIGVISNIQTRKIQEEQAGYHASFDSLTGLWNKNRIAEGLNHMLATAQRYDRQASYVVLSITNITDINSTYGYEAGDRLVKAVADRLKSCVRTPDICGRVSGRTFGIGLTDCGPQEMQTSLSAFWKLLWERPIVARTAIYMPNLLLVAAHCRKRLQVRRMLCSRPLRPLPIRVSKTAHLLPITAIYLTLSLDKTRLI